MELKIDRASHVTTVNKPSIYLSGPISGCTLDDCVAWRNYVEKELTEFRCLSPLRGKEMLKKVGAITDNSVKEQNFTGLDEVKTSDQFIMARDHWDTINSDAIFVNLLNTKIVSIGTVLEIGWAFDRKKPIILVMEKQNIHNHPMIRAASPYQVEDLDSGIELLKLIFAR